MAWERQSKALETSTVQTRMTKHKGKEQTSVRLTKATTETDFRNAKCLFEQYIKSLDFELTFQDVKKELKEIAIQYNYPTGALLLAYKGKKAIACIGVRSFDQDRAELKRMFVYPEYRGQQLGKGLLELSMVEAQKLGYRSILLDTISSMQTAISLYRSFGFKEVEPYRFNPVEGAVFMEKHL